MVIHKSRTKKDKMKIKHIFKTVPVLTVLALGMLAAHAADVSGTWSWSTPGRNGGPERTSTLTVKADGDKLAGKVSAPGRDGATSDSPIVNGKLAGDKISFELVREFNGRSLTNSFAGTVTGDKIVGKIESTRNGEKQSHDWEAKRASETKHN